MIRPLLAALPRWRAWGHTFPWSAIPIYWQLPGFPRKVNTPYKPATRAQNPQNQRRFQP